MPKLKLSACSLPPAGINRIVLLKRLKRFAKRSWVLLVVIAPLNLACADKVTNPETPPVKWTNVPWADPKFFPLAVWLQEPTNAVRYRAAGFNTYVGLWQGPTEDQLTTLKQAGMWVICEQNSVGLQRLKNSTIIGWMQDDEPDNARSGWARFGFGSPIPPEKIVEDYQRMRVADSSHPVLLNLGQGVAWDGWYGRGKRNQHPEDYPAYLKGCDIASFDIYPVVHQNKEVAGKLWYVARGVERLVTWSEGNKMIWNYLECTRVNNPSARLTPHQVRAEAWMSLIHGSRGLIFFVHQFKPVFDETALLDDPEMLAAVTKMNRQISELAPVLNSPTIPTAATVQSENSSVPVAIMVKRHADSTYLFAAGMRDGPTTAIFKLADAKSDKTVEVIGEHRTIAIQNGAFSDNFDPWDVHLYRLPVSAN